MTDRIPHSDELVSAYLDGETTPAETALVEQDAALMARAAELRTVRDAVSAPVTALSVADRERMIGTAMAAADEIPELDTAVVPLRRFSRPLLAMAAAVALIAAVVGVGLLAGRLGGDGEADVALESALTTAAAQTGIVADAEESAGLDSAADAAAEASVEHGAEMAAPMMDEADDAAAEAMAEEPAEESAEEWMAEAEAAMAEAEAAAEGAMAASEQRTDSMSEPAATTLAPLDAPTDADGGGETSQPAQPEEGAPPDESDDEAPEIPVVALGLLDGIDSLVRLVAARSQEQGDLDDPRAEGGACSAAVRDHTDTIGAEIVAAFVATLDETAPVSVDALLIQHDDALSILYAVEPDCAPGLVSLDEIGGE